MKIFNETAAGRLFRCILNFLFLLFVAYMAVRARGLWDCGGGGGGAGGSPPDSEAIYCELDYMDSYEPTFYYFKNELQRANANRSLKIMPDSTNLNAAPEYLRADTFIQDDQVKKYLEEHRSIVDTLTAYDEKVYICGIRKMVAPTSQNPHDSTVGGLTYCNIQDTTVHNEGMSAVAVEYIMEACLEYNKTYGSYLNWVTPHELGHQFNLALEKPGHHCDQTWCMMCPNWSIQSEVFRSSFCDSCLSRLSWSHP